MAEDSGKLMDKLVALCKRRGFIFQSSEIYGGIGGFWDYGPLGVELKRNVKNVWWEDMVRKRDDMVGLDCSIIMNPKVWEASGHLAGFTDPMISCRAEGCKGLFRADHIFWFELREEGTDHTMGAGTIHTPVLAQAKAALVSQLKRIGRDQNISYLKKEPVVEFSDRPGDLTHFDVLRDKSTVASGTLCKANWTALGKDEVPCPVCHKKGTLTEPRAFNLMFKTFVGAMEDSSSLAYLRPETAQGIFCNYKNVLDTGRMKLPFGIAQIGKAFRNEINPRNYTFRSREFEQMEIEFFCRPEEADKWYKYWRDARFKWYVDLGLTSSKLRLRDHEEDELAHYARACADVEYEFPFGIMELEGIANRTDFDLKAHQELSGRDMTYFDDQTRERFIPYVIEPSGGIDRTALAILCEGYTEDEAPDEKGKMQARTVMKLHPRLAPIKVAVFPLVKKEGMPEIARKIHDAVKAAGLAGFYDEKGAIGRRYRRQDEAGTPFCITVDGQTLEDNTVTIRDRDTLAQQRITADEVVPYVQERLS